LCVLAREFKEKKGVKQRLRVAGRQII